MKESKAKSRPFNELQNPAEEALRDGRVKVEQKKEMLKSKDIGLCITVVFMTICFLVAGAAQAVQVRKVLVLDSYHPTYEWTRLVVGGIESTLEQYKDRIELDVEYMDTKQFQDEKHYENLYALYKHKASRKQYDVIIASDNNALLFVLRYRDELYPNVPVVFCGINDFQDSMLQGHDDVTSVIEENCTEATVEIALKLHPSARQMVVISDGTSTWFCPWQENRTGVIQKFGERVEFVSFELSEYNLGQFVEKIDGLGDESVVLITCTHRNRVGSLYASEDSFFEDGLAVLWQRCATPIYTIGRRWFGIGPIVGGSLGDASRQGQIAAEMAMRILDGTSAGDIQILRESPSVYMFNYIQMKRFGISISDLPEGSIVINEPKSFYYLYKAQIWTVAAIIVGLAAMVMVLSANILRRRRAEEKLREYRDRLEELVKERTTQLETANKELTQEIAERVRLERKVLQISTAEQRRIGQDLHDSVGQILAGTAFMSTMLEQKLAEKSLAEAFNAAEISKLLKQALKQTRLLAKGLFPAGLGAEGIMEVLAEFASSRERIFGIACVFKCEKPVLIEDNTVAMHIYRIAQEAVNNAIKHGKSKHVLISLTSSDNSDVVLKVKDDGVGVPENLDNSRGMGLHIMWSRAEMIGGTLDISRDSDGGTVVQCSFRNGGLRQ